VMGSPIKLSHGDYSRVPLTPPPALGQHTAEVLTAVGIDAQELKELRAGGIV
jgi:crotonobetainyl-CoA:carnitine CoA-transferase CaiB-like acyl-CoA transferase